MEDLQNERRMSKLESDLGNIKELLLEIKEDIRNQPYVPRQELTAMFQLRDERITKLEDNDKQSRTLLLAWFGIAVSITSVLVALFHK